MQLCRQYYHAVQYLSVFLIFACDDALDRFTDLSAEIGIQIVEILNVFADNILDRLIQFRILAFCEVSLSQIDAAVFLYQLIDGFAKSGDKAADSLDDLSGFLILRTGAHSRERLLISLLFSHL